MEVLGQALSYHIHFGAQRTPLQSTLLFLHIEIQLRFVLVEEWISSSLKPLANFAVCPFWAELLHFFI
jgi:hypothetical protein